MSNEYCGCQGRFLCSYHEGFADGVGRGHQRIVEDTATIAAQQLRISQLTEDLARLVEAVQRDRRNKDSCNCKHGDDRTRTPHRETNSYADACLAALLEGGET